MKVFEDYFTELQTDMIEICLEYVENKAEKIYVLCSCEQNVTSGSWFCKMNGQVVRKHKLNWYTMWNKINCMLTLAMI